MNFYRDKSVKSVTYNSRTGKEGIDTGKLVRTETTYRHNENSIGDMDTKERPTNAAKGKMPS